MSNLSEAVGRHIDVDTEGNCYLVALQLSSFGTVCHGVVSGQGEHEGERIGHAWIETATHVLDKSNGKSILLPKELYYFIGCIDSDNVRRYTRRQVAEFAVATGHCGPWEEPLEAITKHYT